MSDLGKLLVIAGLALAAAGLVVWVFGAKGWRLPGDIHVAKGNFQFYFPLATCLLISIVLTLVLWLIRR